VSGLGELFADMVKQQRENDLARACEEAEYEFAAAWLEMVEGTGTEAACDATADRLHELCEALGVEGGV